MICELKLIEYYHPSNEINEIMIAGIVRRLKYWTYSKDVGSKSLQRIFSWAFHWWKIINI